MKLIRNILILIAVIGFALTGWLVGHILRHSMPASQFQNPPTEKMDPKIKNGFDFEFEGIRHLTVFSKISQLPQVQVYLDGIQVQLFDGCIGNTYNTSLSAKCRSADGKLVHIGGIESRFMLIPPDK